MDRKKVTGLRLFPDRARFDGTIGEKAQGFLHSMQAAGRCTDRTVESDEFSLSLLATYADWQRWPATSAIKQLRAGRVGWTTRAVVRFLF